MLFCAVSAVLSAFLDALTVTAVVIAVAEGFYSIYHKVASGKGYDTSHDTVPTTTRLANCTGTTCCASVVSCAT